MIKWDKRDVIKAVSGAMTPPQTKMSLGDRMMQLAGIRKRPKSPEAERPL